MKNTKSASYVVFHCDDKGKIEELLYDDLDSGNIFKPGVMFSSTVHRDNLGKALNFFLEIRTNGIAVGWELNITLGQNIESFRFAGFRKDRSIVVIGSRSQAGLLQFIRDQIGNTDHELTTGLEAVSQTFQDQIQKASETFDCDEITRLYNEVSSMHRELAKKNTELERVNALKNQFLGMAAHDLRTSLWTIQMYSRFLLEKLRDSADEDQLNLLTTIVENSENLKSIVGDYLDIATIESGKLKLELKPTDLGELCENCVHLNGILAEKKQIRLSLTYAKFPKLMLDAARIEQVMNNLIHNAIKFSPPQTEIQVGMHRSGDDAVICVQDEGIGIPADIVKILFEPFEGGRTPGTEEEKGSGLGLAIAHKVVQEHGGKIWVESEVGEGSKFSVSLPLNPK